MNTWTVSPLGMAWQLAAASSDNLRVTRPHRASLSTTAAVPLSSRRGWQIGGRAIEWAGRQFCHLPYNAYDWFKFKVVRRAIWAFVYEAPLRILYQSFQKWWGHPEMPKFAPSLLKKVAIVNPKILIICSISVVMCLKLGITQMHDVLKGKRTMSI